jgi:hypothetical protein
MAFQYGCEFFCIGGERAPLLQVDADIGWVELRLSRERTTRRGTQEVVTRLRIPLDCIDELTESLHAAEQYAQSETDPA